MVLGCTVFFIVISLSLAAGSNNSRESGTNTCGDTSLINHGFPILYSNETMQISENTDESFGIFTGGNEKVALSSLRNLFRVCSYDYSTDGRSRLLVG